MPLKDTILNTILKCKKKKKKKDKGDYSRQKNGAWKKPQIDERGRVVIEIANLGITPSTSVMLILSPRRSCESLENLQPGKGGSS